MEKDRVRGQRRVSKRKKNDAECERQRRVIESGGYNGEEE